MTILSETLSEAPKPDEVRAAAERIIASDVFSRSPQLGAFLHFIVDAVLQGKGDRIKAYTIGVEVLRRDSRFDPQLDPIVRVEATRLRRAIERYYTGSGARDPIIIDLPRGSYVPTFRWADAAGSHIEPVKNAAWLGWHVLHQPPTLASIVAIATLAVLALAGVVVYERRGPGIHLAGIEARGVVARGRSATHRDRDALRRRCDDDHVRLFHRRGLLHPRRAAWRTPRSQHPLLEIDAGFRPNNRSLEGVCPARDPALAHLRHR